MRNKQYQDKTFNRTTAAEKRFKGIMNRLYSLSKKRVVFTKKHEMDIAHQINDIQSYGFKFYSGHYTMDLINKLESSINEYERIAEAK